MVAKKDPSEISITRVYDAPVEVVWDAWTDPAQVAQWWGPRGFTLTTHAKDLRVGGIWHYTMHGPDGTDYPNKTFYHVVEEHKKLVYDHGGYDDRPPLFRVTVLFSEENGKTTMDMTMRFPSPEEAIATVAFIKKAGGTATWDRLAEYLSETLHAQTHFVIHRSFEVPVEVLFDMWTKPEHLARWQLPPGFQLRFIHADIKAGGNSFFEMSHSSGMNFFAKFDYSEVTKPEKISYIQQFCDAEKNLSRHPGSPEFPPSMRTTILFASEGPSASRVTVISEILPGTPSSEIEVFKQERPGMTLGWTGSFDQLEEILLKEFAGF